MRRMRFLDELEEAVGKLLAVTAQENSLLLSMDWGQFAVPSPSTHSLQLTKRRLESHIGKKVAIFREADSTKPLRIRLVVPQNELIVGAYQQ